MFVASAYPVSQAMVGRFGATATVRRKTGKPLATDAHTYQITHRDSSLLQHQAGYPRHWVDAKQLKGLKIVDLGCGGGNFVMEMRNQGVTRMIGLDKALSPQQKAMDKVFCKADMRRMPFASNSKDIMYSALGPFSFGDVPSEVQQECLQEIYRVLKPGGKLRLGKTEPCVIRDLLKQLPHAHFTVTDETDMDHFEYGDPKFMELTKAR